MVKLDLGSGFQKPNGYIGVDIVKGVDNIIHDLNYGLPFDDDYADEIRAHDILEHIKQENVIYLMNEIWRVLKPNGILDFDVPDASRGQAMWQDPTHYSHWVKNSFLYYANDHYRKLYNIKAKFYIEELREIQVEKGEWGELFRVVGKLKAIKPVSQNLLKQYIDNNYIITTDDLCVCNLKNFKYWDKVKIKYSELKLIAFTIANHRNHERIDKSKEFRQWFETHNSWVEIGVHGYDHLLPQECFRDDQEKYMKDSFKILKNFLPKDPIYRPPGFKYLNWTEDVLQRLGFGGIAHQNKIKYFNGTYANVFNTHCTEKDFDMPIGRLWKDL